VLLCQSGRLVDETCHILDVDETDGDGLDTDSKAKEDMDVDALAWRVAIVPCNVSDVPHSPPFAHLRPSLLENVPYFLDPSEVRVRRAHCPSRGVLLGY
jgi:hypothetical protein